MGNKQSEADILKVRKSAIEMLTGYGIKDFPTPVDDVIEASCLCCSKYDPREKGLWTKFNEKAKSVFHKIKAILCIQRHEILIDKNIHYAKEPFAKLHEVGHFKIPWHGDILYVCSELDLEPRTRRIMEIQANVFASETLFQGDKFAGIAEQFPLRMDTIFYLKSFCGTSYESTARRYVETSRHSCALVVLEPTPSIVKSGVSIYKLEDIELKHIYTVYSKSFMEQFGRLYFFEPFSSDHILSQIVNENNSESIMEGEIEICDRTFKTQTFFNHYRVFALLIG